MSEGETKNTNATQFTIHSVRNIIGHSNQLTLFSDQHTKLSQTYGNSLDESIDRFGIDLTDIQMRVMEGILRGFTQTNYKGNISPEDKESIAHQKYSGKLPDTYKYVREIPRIRATQKQIIEWAGLNPGSIGDKERAVNALCQLGIKQFCVLYDRLAFNDHGEPEKDKNGNWKKEVVTSVDTLFNIKIVREEAVEKSSSKDPKLGDVKYYEISPSGIFLDQRETYFLLIPFNWREEVHALYGKKKISSYVFRFLWFLRFQYELKRRKNQERPFQLRWSSEEIAIALKMPKSVYKGQKDRMNQILEEAYSVAKTLGYLSSYERTGTVDILVLQDAKYSTTHNPTIERAMGAISSNVSPALNYLFEFFHKKKKELNHYHEAPTNQEKEEQLREFNLLLSQKKAHEIEEMINWGLSQKFWCTRLSTPQLLSANFDEAWSEMNAVAKKQIGASNVLTNHKKIAHALRKMILEKTKNIEIVPMNTSVVVKKSDSGTAITIEYNAKDFKKQIEDFLKVLQIPFSVFASYLNSID